MSDLIDRQAAIDALKEYFSDEDRTDTEYGAYWHHKHVLDVLEKLPSAQPEQKKGKWIDTGSGQECSECHEIQYGYDNFRFFCPNCGADMRGEQDEMR